MSIINESTYGRLVSGHTIGDTFVAGEAEMVIPFTSESLAHNINTLESATLDPTRGTTDVIRGTSDISGDVAFELRGIGYGQLIKQAMGSGASGSKNYVKVANARGDLAVQVDGFHAIGALTLAVRAEREMMADIKTEYDAVLPGVGIDLAVIYRDSSNLLAAETLTPSAVTVVGIAGDPVYTHSFTVAATTIAHRDAEWVFPVDAGKYAGSVLHYIELGTDLPNGMNVDVVRDIALFVYTGIKVGSWSMNFNSNETVNGTFSLLGREELCGGVLTTEIANNAAGVAAARTLVCSDVRIFNASPTNGVTSVSALMLGHEGHIYYSSVTATSGAALGTDGAHFDFPIPGSIGTPNSSLGIIAEGTDQIGDGTGLVPWTNWTLNRERWGYYVGQPVVPMSQRANNNAVVVDLEPGLAGVTAVSPYSFFEANILMVSGLTSSTTPLVPSDRTGSKGCELIEVMNASFTVENNLYGDKYALGSRYRVKVIEQKRAVTGSLTFEFDNLNQYRKFFDGRSFGFVIKCVATNPSSGYIAGNVRTVPYSTCFYFNKCRYTGSTPQASGPDMIMTDMPFTALVSGGSATEKPFTELAVWMTNDRTADLWA